jgi:YVTN family beta-propeller protein
MKINKLFFLALCGAAFLTSCSSDDDGGNTPIGQYDEGLFVLNEGDAVSGSVTFISGDLATVENDVFGTVNAGSGQSIGGYVQSMFFDGDKAYIISNGSNKITVVNRYTFEYIGSVSTGLAVPRYGVVHEGKAYVTNLNSFMTNTDDYLAVIDLATLTVGAPIAINDYADHIVAANGKLYVANGSFGMGSHVTVIDTATSAITTTLDMGQSPNSMEAKDDIVYVLCGSGSGDSKMVRIVTVDDASTDENEEDTIDSSVIFDTALDNAQNLDIESNRAYFTVGPKIYRVALNAVAVNDTPIIDTESTSSYIGYGFAVRDGRIFISEGASDFVSNGKIFVYSTSGGEPIATKTVGLGPNGFFFNY